LSLLALLLSSLGSIAQQPLTNAWSVNIGCYCDSSPAVADDGTIVFGAWDGKLRALHPDGSSKWVFQTRLEIHSSPAVAPDGTVYIGSRDRSLYAVGRDGRKLWAFPTGGWVDCSPALARDGTVYFGSWDKTFYALNRDGSKKWQLLTGGPIVSSPAIGADGTIFFGSNDRKFYALKTDGTRAWDFTTGGAVLSSPAIGPDGTLYFASLDGFFYALAPDGKQRWRLRTGGTTASCPIIATGGWLIVGVSQEWWAISSEGSKLWNQGDEMPITGSALALGGDVVSFLVSWDLLVGYTTNHEQKWVFKFPCTRGSTSPVALPSGKLYCSGVSQHFFALNGSPPLAATSWPKFRGDLRNTGNVQLPASSEARK
jgi:outer membrane protein assembly factor BamB